MNLPTTPLMLRNEVRVADQEDGLVEPQVGASTGPAAPRRLPFWRRVIAGLVQLLIVAGLSYGGYQAYQQIVETAPRAERKGRERIPRLVEVATVAPAAKGPVIEAWGNVEPAQTLIVRPEVGGTIVWVHPEVTPGGLLPAGVTVARLDDRDLRLAVLQAEAAIAEIDARILIERGQAEIGKRELSRLTRNLTDEQRALVLREPQMKQLMAERATAAAILEQARNAAERAIVNAPFDALVISESVAPGAAITQGAEAATLVAADRFHVSLDVPESILRWIDLGQETMVRLSQPGTWPEGAERIGRIVRRGSGLTETGRMAELIVEVKDPMALKPENRSKPVLLLGGFVKGTIEGTPVEGAVLVDRAHIRDNETVWVMTPDDTLEVRKIDIAWRGPETALVRSGLEAGERIVTTPLATFAPGMALRTRGGASG